jgi:hypothetical protein
MLTLVRMNRSSCPMVPPSPKRQARGAGRDQQEPEVEQAPAEPADQGRAAEHAEDQPRDHWHKRHAGVHRRPAFAELAIERDAQQPATERAEQREGR